MIKTLEERIADIKDISEGYCYSNENIEDVRAAALYNALKIIEELQNNLKQEREEK